MKKIAVRSVIVLISFVVIFGLFFALFPQNLQLIYLYNPFDKADYSNTKILPTKRPLKTPLDFDFKGAHRIEGLAFESPWQLNEVFRNDNFIGYESSNIKMITQYSALNDEEIEMSLFNTATKLSGNPVNTKYEYFSYILNRSIANIKPFGVRYKNWNEGVAVVLKSATMILIYDLSKIEEVHYNGFRTYILSGKNEAGTMDYYLIVFDRNDAMYEINIANSNTPAEYIDYLIYSFQTI